MIDDPTLEFLNRLDKATPLIASLMKERKHQVVQHLAENIQPKEREEKRYLVTESQLKQRDKAIAQEVIRRVRPRPRSTSLPLPVPHPKPRPPAYEPPKKSRAARFQDEINDFRRAFDSL